MERVLALVFEESDDEDEFVRRPRWIRVREEDFDTLDDKDFVTRFRLTKETALSVLESIEDKLEFPTNVCYVGKKKNIYLVSPIVRDVVANNEKNIKIINTGVKTFVRCDNKNMTCAFRLSQEGLSSISPYIGTKRRITILRDDLIKVLQNENPTNPPDLTEFSEHTQAQVKDLATGSCILQYHDLESNLSLPLVGWRGVRSLRAYTHSSDTVHYLRLLGADYSKYDVNKFKKTDETNDDETVTMETDNNDSTTNVENGESNGRSSAKRNQPT